MSRSTRWSCFTSRAVRACDASTSSRPSSMTISHFRVGPLGTFIWSYLMSYLRSKRTTAPRPRTPAPSRRRRDLWAPAPATGERRGRRASRVDKRRDLLAEPVLELRRLVGGDLFRLLSRVDLGGRIRDDRCDEPVAILPAGRVRDRRERRAGLQFGPKVLLTDPEVLGSGGERVAFDAEAGPARTLRAETLLIDQLPDALALGLRQRP